jgi:nitroreductase
MLTSTKKKIITLLKTSKSTSFLYYLLVSIKSGDENSAVFSGLKEYQKNEEEGNLSTLRRNIHRIEKGLITTPPKKYFAESFILETVKNLEKLIKNPKEEETNIWAIDILTQYFDTVEKTDKIREAHECYLNIAVDNINKKYSTYVAEGRKEHSVSYEDLLLLNKHRRSVRYYNKQTVPRILVEQAVSVALQSPSACNRQPFMFRIIDDPNLLSHATSLPIGTKSFASEIPMLVFVIGDLSNYFDTRDKHLIYIDGALAAMNFVLALETLELSSCMINWADLPDRNKALKQFLNLNPWERCVMAISVGYANPQGGIPSSAKKEVKNVIKYNL